MFNARIYRLGSKLCRRHKRFACALRSQFLQLRTTAVLKVVAHANTTTKAAADVQIALQILTKVALMARLNAWIKVNLFTKNNIIYIPGPRYPAQDIYVYILIN